MWLPERRLARFLRRARLFILFASCCDPMIFFFLFFGENSTENSDSYQPEFISLARSKIAGQKRNQLAPNPLTVLSKDFSLSLGRIFGFNCQLDLRRGIWDSGDFVFRAAPSKKPSFFSLFCLSVLATFGDYLSLSLDGNYLSNWRADWGHK